MNLRQKFIWNVVVTISVIILLWNSYSQLTEHNKVKKSYEKFKNEEVGTDRELQNMIIDLEKNLSSRQNMKFKIKENPLELTKIISVDGTSLSLTGQKGIDCNMVWSNNENANLEALCSYKSNRYVVTVGDSIGGGHVTNITDSKVFIYKDEKELMFDLGFDKYNNN